MASGGRAHSPGKPTKVRGPYDGAYECCCSCGWTSGKAGSPGQAERRAYDHGKASNAAPGVTQ